MIVPTTPTALTTLTGDTASQAVRDGVKWDIAPKRAADFTAEERNVIRERRKLQPASELAAVFGTSSAVIARICQTWG